jgi:glycosyltransferase involved in cell wall biosynthesis
LNHNKKYDVLANFLIDKIAEIWYNYLVNHRRQRGFVIYMKILFNGYKNLFDGSTKGVAGGPRLFTLQLIEHLRKNHHQFVGLVLHSKLNTGEGLIIQQHKVTGGEWVEASMRMNLNLILNSKALGIKKYTKSPLQKLAEIIAAEKPDVILLNGFSIINWYILKAAHLAKIPTVVSHHGLWFKEAMEIMAKSTAQTLKLVRKMEKDIYLLASRQIFLNHFSQKTFEKEYRITTNRKASVIPIPYNPIFINSKLPQAPKRTRKKIGFVGRWDAIKNPQIIYEIAREAKRQKKNWEIFAVLKVNEAKALRNLRKRFTQTVTVIPPMLPSKLKQFYQDMDILLLPSRFDVSPTVVIEAALQNRVTIISPSVGFADEYKEMGLKNWIHDFKNPKSTLKYIEKMITTPIPSQFTTSVIKKHQPDKILSQYMSVLRAAARKENS